MIKSINKLIAVSSILFASHSFAQGAELVCAKTSTPTANKPYQEFTMIESQGNYTLNYGINDELYSADLKLVSRNSVEGINFNRPVNGSFVFAGETDGNKFEISFDVNDGNDNDIFALAVIKSTKITLKNGETYSFGSDTLFCTVQ